MSDIDEIKNRLDIVDVISEYVQLKPAGTNHKARCPFHSEKTPSFVVSKERQIWHCFGCGEGGDAFTFLQKIEGIEFPEALKILADKAGVKLERQNPQIASQKNTLFDIMERTANYWHNLLLDSPQAQQTRNYLKERGISQKSIEDFKLGYSPNSWDETLKFLQERSFRDNDIFLAGLAIKKDRGAGFYDRFRNRLMFPIHDAHGRVVGFGGRTLEKNAKEAKYINSPQTMIYNKSLIIYNLDKAKNAIRENNLAIVVEGYMDIIASVQAGVENVVATSGTAITNDQLQMTKRYSENIAFSFDQDLAGVSASFRGIELALGHDVNLKVITLPSGKDPDECVKNNPADWISAIKNAKPFMDYYFGKILEKRDLSNIADKKEAAKILLKMISRLNNKIEQAHWLQKLSSILNVREEILREALPQNKLVKSSRPEKAESEFTGQKPTKEDIFLSLILKYPDNLDYCANHLKIEYLSDRPKELYKNLIIYYTKEKSEKFILKDFCDYLSQKSDNQVKDLANYAETLTLLAERDFFDFDSGQIKEIIMDLVKKLKKAYLSQELSRIAVKLKTAESEQSKSDIENLSREFSQIASEINILE